MKTQVFVLVPYEIAPVEISDFVQGMLEGHRFDPDDPASRGRFDYLVGALAQSLVDPAADAELPPEVRQRYSGNICRRDNLPLDHVPGALVTLDGQWHDLEQYGWKMAREPSRENRVASASWGQRYRELIAAQPHCWVVEVWAHS